MLLISTVRKDRLPNDTPRLPNRRRPLALSTNLQLVCAIASQSTPPPLPTCSPRDNGRAVSPSSCNGQLEATPPMPTVTTLPPLRSTSRLGYGPLEPASRLLPGRGDAVGEANCPSSLRTERRPLCCRRFLRRRPALPVCPQGGRGVGHLERNRQIPLATRTLGGNQRAAHKSHGAGRLRPEPVRKRVQQAQIRQRLISRVCRGPGAREKAGG